MSWSPPLAKEQNGAIINYVINITEDATGDRFQEFTFSAYLTIDNNLRPYYTYTCAIAAETSVGVGPFSSMISFTTHEYGIAQTMNLSVYYLIPILVPSEPSISVSRRDGEPNELLVTWTAPENPNGIILNYTVYCDTSPSSESGDNAQDTEFLDAATVAVSGSARSAVVMNLIPYTYYDCYVTANTSVGEGNSSSVESAQTDESGQSVEE